MLILRPDGCHSYFGHRSAPILNLLHPRAQNDQLPSRSLTVSFRKSLAQELFRLDDLECDGVNHPTSPSSTLGMDPDA